MKLEPVQSSNIAAVGHDPETNKLVVQFKSGAMHAYEGVSAEDHAALISADSIGSHFHHNIKSKFPSSKYDGDGQTGE